MLTQSASGKLGISKLSAGFERVERLPNTGRFVTSRILPLRELATDVRGLSKISESRAILSVARQWIVIGSTIALFVIFSPHLSWVAWIPVYLLACLVIASRQHAFLALVHEGAHYRLSDRRPWNNLLSDFFCAFSVGMSTDVYRRLHLLHHQFTNTSEDPDWVGMNMQEDWHWPKDHLSTAKLFLFDLVGLAAHKILLLLFMWSPWQAILRKHVSLSWAERLRLVCFLGLVGTSLTVGHAWSWFFLLWIVPMSTFLGAMVRMRAVAEHLVCPSKNELNESRHVEATWFERLTIAPLNVNYHLAHHLFPSVPWYNLPKLHQKLRRFEVFRKQAKVSTSYLSIKHGVLGEILKPTVGRAS
jgi:fatty acid desaturase